MKNYIENNLINFVFSQARKIKKCCCCCCDNATDEEKAPLLSQQILVPELRDSEPKRRQSEPDSFSVEIPRKVDLLKNAQIKVEVGMNFY